MGNITTFEDIEAWQRAREMTRDIYRCVRKGHFARDFGLRDQICSAAVSVMSNIAEGFERGGDKEFIQFLSTAKGSCGEVRSQLYVAKDNGYISEVEFSQLTDMAKAISKMIAGLMKYLKRSQLKGSKYS
ncbi:MAG: four helix bundle protein [Verrucomicrobia bacterium]|nr:four helix bundle protein [Verrucomicrobiota bacterium]